jgi:endoglucanase
VRAIITIAAACLFLTACVAAPGLPPSDVALRVQGPDLVDDDGNAVTLRAINLGNWLLLEMWMLAGQPLPDQQAFLDVLAARFGQAEADRLLAIYRDNWITQRDMDQVAAAGFNAVRLPFSHLVLESEPFVFDDEGFAIIRRAIDMADQAGLYVILDMHQVPGGQSLDQPSGDVTANDLWTDPEAQERLAWLWQSIARRVKNDRNVVAYDLINEPYSAFNDDVRPQLLSIVDRTIRAIREIDPDRLIYAPGAIQGIRFYGRPADRGWTNTGFTEHFYPGVFDWRERTTGDYARFLQTQLRDRARYSRSVDAPYLWGEFNPVFDTSGSHGAIRDALDDADAMGISAAVWSHKILTPQGGLAPNNWYLVTNENPFPLTDVRTAPLATIESAFESLATMSLAVDQQYLDALSQPDYPRTLPDLPAPPFEPPATDTWTAWSATDVGEALLPGGQALAPGATPLAADGLTIYTAGQDLFSTADSLRLVSRPVPADFAVSAVLDPFEGGQYAQAGVTIRASEQADAAHLSLVAFTDGRVLVKQRGFTGTSTSQRYIATSGFPVGLALGRTGTTFSAWITDENGAWRTVPISENPAVGTQPRAGFLGAANREGPLSTIRFDAPTLDLDAILTTAPTLDAGTNLLANHSFEQASGGSTNPASWVLEGPQMSRQTGWVPVRDGAALLAFRHWEVTSDAPQAASQIVTGFLPGETYALAVYANRDTVGPGRALADAVELRVEQVGSPVRWNERVRFDVAEIATGSRWSRLQVRFTATKPDLRVRLVAYPGSGNRDGAVKFDGLHLEREP